MIQIDNSQKTHIFRVLIGFNFNPKLSGDRRSGEMQSGLNGLLGLTLSVGLYNPNPIRKYSSGINMAWGCSSVTIDPHTWTYTSTKNYIKSALLFVICSCNIIEVERNSAYLDQGAMSSINLWNQMNWLWMERRIVPNKD